MTLGEKIDRALDIADLSITELSEAIDVQPRLIRSLMEDKAKPVSVPLKVWKLLSVALDVPMEYWLPDDIDDDITQTLLTVKAAHAIHEEQSDAIRAWEKQMDQDRRKRWRK